ncbi:unnamed protein product, partial [Polarella glacialis]
FGFIHRLDVPSSGLILAGTTFQGLYSLRLQINSLTMCREYVVLCHDVAPSSLRECRAPIDMVAKRCSGSGRSLGERSVSERGKPALTRLSFVAHVVDRAQLSIGTASLVAIRIHTGRNHQIRTHLLHCAHPTLVDGKYTCRSVSLRIDGDVREEIARAHCTEPRDEERQREPQGVQRLPRSTSGMELRAFPGDETSGPRQPHRWSWDGKPLQGSHLLQATIV